MSPTGAGIRILGPQLVVTLGEVMTSIALLEKVLHWGGLQELQPCPSLLFHSLLHVAGKGVIPKLSVPVTMPNTLSLHCTP